MLIFSVIVRCARIKLLEKQTDNQRDWNPFGNEYKLYRITIIINYDFIIVELNVKLRVEMINMAHSMYILLY